MALDSLVTKSALDKTSTAYTARQPVEINRGTILLNYDSRYFDCTEDIGLRLNFSTDELTNYRFTIAVNGYRLSFVGIFAPRFESLAASIERKIATMTGQKFNNFSDALTYISNA